MIEKTYHPSAADQRKAQQTEMAKTMGFTGNICSTCGQAMMVRNGTCEKCTVCGSTTGCS